ncbi:hypothetical protein HOY80DRAFT_946394 [Tuber brumale]|nr:hypothetical protein HOY80DRAFT_946394 [Tuber brumale]
MILTGFWLAPLCAIVFVGLYSTSICCLRFGKITYYNFSNSITQLLFLEHIIQTFTASGGKQLLVGGGPVKTNRAPKRSRNITNYTPCCTLSSATSFKELKPWNSAIRMLAPHIRQIWSRPVGQFPRHGRECRLEGYLSWASYQPWAPALPK